MSDVVYWIWLSLSVTPGTQTFAKLIEKYRDIKTIYSLDERDLASCIGSKSPDYTALLDKDLSRAQEILDFCLRKKIGILKYCDGDFPIALREIPDPPVLLYYRGTLPEFNRLCFVAVVGTRHLTDYGRKNAFSIAHDLARTGIVIVSGMAIGIDGVAMAGALSASGQTVAFLGSGIDVCYPEVHKTLARAIVKNGCVMTEYPPATKPEGRNFPRRNRLISGLCCATVIIEGSDRSGAMITARFAKKQGRSLYALPGNVDNKTSQVSNVLIKNGAKLITDAYDIVEDFEFVYPGRINPFKAAEPSGVRMFDELRRYEIACVVPSDPIFNPFARKRKEERNVSQKEADDVRKSEQTPPSSPTEAGFDKFALEVYKRIPTSGECEINSIVRDGEDVRDVMKALLKLNMGSFIEMLPGECVRRKKD